MADISGEEILSKIEQLEKVLGEVNREIVLQNGHKFSPDFDAFIRNGAAYCRALTILRGPNDSAFSGLPPNFFDNLIKHFHETENPHAVVASLNIALAMNNPAPWPTTLVLLHGADLGLISKEQLEKDGVPTLTEEKVFHDERKVDYSMQNKNNPMIGFKLSIHFEGEAKCYRQMTGFAAERIDIDQIVIGYALQATDCNRDIILKNGHQYTPEMGILLRFGADHCSSFGIFRGTSDNAFVGYPADFFDGLIQHYYETKVPTKAVPDLVIELSLTNPAPWPAALVQPRAGKMNVEEKVNNECEYAEFNLPNKHNPDIAFKLGIHFDGNAICHQQMTRFEMFLED